MEMAVDTKTPDCLFAKCWTKEKTYSTHSVAPNSKGYELAKA